MDIKRGYNKWAAQYDINKNRTRDLEAQALRNTLANIKFEHVLEIGCGTGKNTAWFAEKAKQVTAVDLSEEMLAIAKEKIKTKRVQFVQADILESWLFRKKLFDLVSFSLVLEHIENLDPVFKETSLALKPGGHVYIGELHPFKQYTGTKARFTSEAGQQVLTCYNHHISDFIRSAKKYELNLADMEEYFDENNKEEIPRVLSIIFKKEA